MEIYETSADGRLVYNECLEKTDKYFPQYLVELKGIATGANVPFHKVSPKSVYFTKNKMLEYYNFEFYNE